MNKIEITDELIALKSKKLYNIIMNGIIKIGEDIDNDIETVNVIVCNVTQIILSKMCEIKKEDGTTDINKTNELFNETLEFMKACTHENE